MNTKQSYYQLSNGNEVADIAMFLNFSIGNVVKYLFRAGKKDNEAFLKDVKKAYDYVLLEQKRIKDNNFTSCYSKTTPFAELGMNWLYLEKDTNNKYAKRALGILHCYVFGNSEVALNTVELLLRWLKEEKYQELDYKFF